MLQRLLCLMILLPLESWAESATSQLSEVGSEGAKPALFAGLSSWFFSTLSIVALILVLGYLLKKSKLAVNKRSGELYLETQMAVGPKERLMIVRVRGRSILLGVTAHQVSYLCEVSGREGREFERELDSSRAQLHRTEDSTTGGQHEQE